MNLGQVVWGLFETNHFTLALVLVLGFFWALRFLKLRIPWSGRAIWLTAIVAGVLLRAFWLSYSSYQPKTEWNTTHLIESDFTNMQALDLTKGVWFHDQYGNPSGRRPCGYPLVLGAAYALFGRHVAVLWTLNLILFALSAFFLHRIARRLFGNAAAALALWLYALYPVSIYSITMATDEHLFLPLWYGGILLLLHHIESGSDRWKIPAYGAIFGYATMTRTHSIFMPVVVALVYRLIGRSWKKALVAGAAVMLIMQFLNAPWVVRNQRVFGTPVLYTATNQYVYRYFNSKATFEGGEVPKPGDPDFSQEIEDAKNGGNEALYHKACGRAMKRWMIHHPFRAAYLGTGRLVIFMGWDRKGIWPLWFQFMEGSYDPARPIPQGVKDFLEETAYAVYYVIFFCSIGGVVLLSRTCRRYPPAAQKGMLALAACFLLWFAEQMIIYPDRKYRYPLEPLMILLAAAALARLANFGGSGKKAQA